MRRLVFSLTILLVATSTLTACGKPKRSVVASHDIAEGTLIQKGDLELNEKYDDKNPAPEGVLCCLSEVEGQKATQNISKAQPFFPPMVEEADSHAVTVSGSEPLKVLVTRAELPAGHNLEAADVIEFSGYCQALKPPKGTLTNTDEVTGHKLKRAKKAHECLSAEDLE